MARILHVAVSHPLIVGAQLIISLTGEAKMVKELFVNSRFCAGVAAVQNTVWACVLLRSCRTGRLAGMAENCTSPLTFIVAVTEIAPFWNSVRGAQRAIREAGEASRCSEGVFTTLDSTATYAQEGERRGRRRDSRADAADADRESTCGSGLSGYKRRKYFPTALRGGCTSL